MYVVKDCDLVGGFYKKYKIIREGSGTHFTGKCYQKAALLIRVRAFFHLVLRCGTVRSSFAGHTCHVKHRLEP